LLNIIYYIFAKYASNNLHEKIIGAAAFRDVFCIQKATNPPRRDVFEAFAGFL